MKVAKNRNCPNCGAPYDHMLDKCPFCGTIYFDMSCVDFSSGEPIFLKFRVKPRSIMPDENGTMIMTQKVIPRMDEVSMRLEHDTTRYVGPLGSKMVAWHSQPTMTMEMRFEAIPMDDGSLCKMEVIE